MMLINRGWLWLIIALAGSLSVHAGSTNAPVGGSEALVARAEFSKYVEKTLAKHRVELAIVGRLGRPKRQLPTGVRFTHVGIAVYSTVTGADGAAHPAYVFYNLYQSSEDPSISELVKDSAFEFFSATTAVKAGVIVPNRELQQRLRKLLLSRDYDALHRRSYSAIANPLSLKFQNCTEFVTDLLTAAIYDTNDHKQIKANERAYFKPTLLDLSRMKVTLGAIFHSGLSMADHSGAIQTATFGSIADYLERHHALSEIFTLCGEKHNCHESGSSEGS